MTHALMMAGQQGSGLLAHALSIAKALFCQNPDHGKPCGQCNNCEKVQNGVHPDLHFTFPTVAIDRKTTSDKFLKEWRAYLRDRAYVDYFEWLSFISKDTVKQGNITKDECERLTRIAQMKSYEGGKKVFIIWKAELLAKEGNRLLKTLEEPPMDTHFILLCNNIERILPTILSRCQVVKVRPYTNEELAVKLQSADQHVPEQRLKEIIYLSSNNAHQAFSLLQETEYTYSESLLQLLRQAYVRTDASMQVKWINQMAMLPRQQMKQFFQYAIHFMNECIKSMVYTEQDYKKKLTRNEQKAANWVIGKFELDHLRQILALFNKSITYVDRNANAKILFTNTMTKLVRLFHVTNYELVNI